jgi:tetratricopeptide (TPR) repeat protein
LLEFGYVEDAIRYLHRAISVAPTSDTAHALLGSIYLNQKKDCKSAISSFEEAIEISPITKIYYQYLYTSYIRCSQTVKAEKLKVESDKVFGSGSIRSINSSGQIND